MRTKYKCNYSFLENINSHEKAQIIGLLFADGCIFEQKNAVKISLSEDDLDYINTIKYLFGSDKPLYCDNRKGKRFFKIHNKSYNIQNMITLSLNNKKLMDDCMKLGIVSNKTYINCSIPPISDQYINSFILGHFEGDGCITISANQSKVSDTKYIQYKCYLLLTDNMLKEITPYFINLGITYKTHKHKNCSNNINRVCIQKIQHLIKLYHWLYKDTSFVMKRKHDKWIQLMNIFKEKGYDVGELYSFN